MAVVTMTQWARISAKAWLGGNYDVNGKFIASDYQNLLETNPLAALNLVRKDFGIRDEAKHFDIDDPTYSAGTDESGSEPKFAELTLEQLETIIKDGTFGNRPAKMIPSEWISYPPLYTQSREHPGDGLTLSLLEWARIIAYLYRFKFVKAAPFPDLKDQFETDPATALDTLVNGGFVKGAPVKGLLPEFGQFGVEIKYTRGQTALFRLGDPPNPNLVKLQDVLDNANSYARVMVRLCC